MDIKLLSPGHADDHARWDDFVYACPEATFFHRAAWQTVIRDVFRHPTYFLYAEQHGEIQGVLPLAHVNSLLFGNSLVALPFAVYGGVAANTPEAAAALEAEAQSLARKLAVDHLEFRNIKPRHAEWPTQSLYVTFRKEILPDVEANMLAIPRKQRAMVRKGINNGLQSVIDSNADQFFALFADNVHRHGTPALSRRYFTVSRNYSDERSGKHFLDIYHRVEKITVGGSFNPFCNLMTSKFHICLLFFKPAHHVS